MSNQTNPVKDYNAVDLMLLNPVLTLDETLAYCAKARNLDLASVYVKPCYLHQVMDAVRGADISIGTVIGFPHGANALQTKVAETKYILTEGACDLELAINMGRIISGGFDLIQKEVESICGLTHMNGGVLKVIIETNYLTIEKVKTTAKFLSKTWADWLVISTSLAPNAHFLDTIECIHETLGDAVPIKATGKIATFQEINALLVAGCTRVGIYETSDFLRAAEPGFDV